MPIWDPNQYLKFADHRLRPALDLLARIDLDTPAAIVDLGCGAGNVTAHLHRRWPSARMIGVDGSTEMLAKAKGTLPTAEWVEADIARWDAPDQVDLVYSNAALHWLADHGRLFPRIMGWLRPNGVLAVQMPRNYEAPSHTLILDTARSGPWREKLTSILRPSPVAAPEAYWRFLSPHCRRLDIWETVYMQAMEGENPIAEFTKGTALKPLLDALDGPDREAFETAYRARVAAAYPREADGRTLFPFRRMFIIAER